MKRKQTLDSVLWLLLSTFVKTVYLQSDKVLARCSFDFAVSVSLKESSSAAFMNAILFKGILLC